MTLNTISNQLAEVKNEDDTKRYTLTPIEGDTEILRVTIVDLEEAAIYLSVSDQQILCMSYLFNKNEVKSDLIDKLNEAMLLANVAVPLSSFAVIDEQYVIFGALSINSSIDDIVTELDTLSANYVEAIDAMAEYLN